MDEHARTLVPGLYAAGDLACVRVRRVAADGVRELVEVMPAPEGIADHLNSADPVVRSVAVYLLSARRVGERGQYRRASTDADHRVRIEAVRALVSFDDSDGVAAAAFDDNREVRIAAANGLSRCAAAATRCADSSGTEIHWCARRRWPPLARSDSAMTIWLRSSAR